MVELNKNSTLLSPAVMFVRENPERKRIKYCEKFAS